MFTPLPSTLLAFIFALPALSYASPQPALVSSDYEISLVPRHTLFLRQVSDLQTFDQALGGTRASAITNSGDTKRPFTVDGDTFTDFNSAAQRSCDNQFQACQKAANGNNNNGGSQAKTNQVNTNSNGNKNGGGNGNGNNNDKNKNNNNNDGNKNQGNANNNNNQGNGNNNNNNNDNKNKNKDRRQIGEAEWMFEKRQNGGLSVNDCDKQKGQLTYLKIRPVLALKLTNWFRSVQFRTRKSDSQGFSGCGEHEYWT
jgi:hypothetical protein